MNRKILFTIMLLLSAAVPDATAQEPVDTTFKHIEAVVDSITAIDGEKSIMVTGKEEAKPKKARKDWSEWRPDVKKALWMAIVIPGGGQIYNRKYWKLPIVYGGLVGCIYAMRWNGQMYDDYSKAYTDIMDDDPETKSYEKFLHLGASITDDNLEHYKTLFKNRKDRYRRWRDMSLFCMIGVYGLSIIDAYVDASLSQFDISDNLSMKVTPAFIDASGKNMTASRSSLANGGLGVRCRLSF